MQKELPKDIFENDPRVKIVGYIYETSDYSMFGRYEWNREVEKFGRIKSSMKKYGFMNCPVVVDLVDGKLMIGEGQHREASAEELEIPVKFSVQEGITREQVIAANTGQKNWGTDSYLHSRICENENYARFDQLKKMFPFPNNVIYTAMGVSVTGGGVNGAIKDGALTCTEAEYEEACRELRWLQEFGDVLKTNKMKGSRSNFYIALLFARNCKFVNASTLAKRVRENFYLYGTRFGSVEEEVAKTEKAYNFKVPANNKVYLVDAYRKAADESQARFTKRTIK